MKAIDLKLCTKSTFAQISGIGFEKLGMVVSSEIALVLGQYTAFWLFSFGAFCILFSTVLSGIGAGSRSFPDLLVTLGFIPRENLPLRRKWITGYIIAMPIVSMLIYLSYSQPVALVVIGASFGAFMLPLQSFLTLYLHRRRMDPRVRPRSWVTVLVGCIFVVQAVLAAFVIRNVFA